jgi:hypothetical protein
VVFQHVRDGARRTVERVGPVDDGSDLAGFEELDKRVQVLVVNRRGHKPHPGAAESHKDRPRRPGQASQQAAGVPDAVRDEHSCWCQYPRGYLGRVVQHVVEDDVESRPALGEVLVRVVNDVVRAERPDQFDVVRTAHTSDLGPQYLGDLDRHAPEPATSAVDQDTRAGPHLCHVAHGDEGGKSGHDRCRGVGEAESGGLLDDPRRRGRHVLGEGASGGTEHLVTGH